MGGGGAEGSQAPAGPVQHRLLRLLAERSPDLAFSTGVAARSRLGPGTVTVRPADGGGELDGIAAWLDRQPGVETVALKNSHLHVRLEADVLREWFRDGWRDAFAAPAPEAPPLTLAVPAEEAPCPLGRSRKSVVAGSLRALLERQGHVVAVTASTDEHLWLHGTEAAAGASDPLRLDVAEVDAKHDRLRARHGGVVTLEDLRADICDDAILLEGRKRSADYADAAISYLMTQAPRERRLAVDNQAIGQKLGELDEILAVQVRARKKGAVEGAVLSGLSEQGELAIRALIAQIESAPGAVARAAGLLDPAPVNRLLRSLAHEMRAAEGDLPEGDPLWAAAAEALEAVLRLVAPNAPAVTPAQELQGAAD